MKSTIAIDVDDVLAAHVPALVTFSNQRYGTNLTIEDYAGHMAGLWKIEHMEAEARALEFHTTVSAMEYAMVEASNHAIEQLRRKYNLCIVTARPKRMIEPTYEWLQQYYPGVFTDVHFVPIWEPGSTVTKRDICNDIGAQYLIDDLPRHCNVAAEGGITAVLFGDYAWNRDEVLHSSVVRARDWEAVVEYFDGIRG